MFNALRNLIPPAQVYVVLDTAAPSGPIAIKAHTTLKGAWDTCGPKAIVQGPIPVYHDTLPSFPPNPPNPPNPLAAKYRVPGPYKYLFTNPAVPVSRLH